MVSMWFLWQLRKGGSCFLYLIMKKNKLLTNKLNSQCWAYTKTGCVQSSNLWGQTILMKTATNTQWLLVRSHFLNKIISWVFARLLDLIGCKKKASSTVVFWGSWRRMAPNVVNFNDAQLVKRMIFSTTNLVSLNCSSNLWYLWYLCFCLHPSPPHWLISPVLMVPIEKTICRQFERHNESNLLKPLQVVIWNTVFGCGLSMNSHYCIPNRWTFTIGTTYDIYIYVYIYVYKYVDRYNLV